MEWSLPSKRYKCSIIGDTLFQLKTEKKTDMKTITFIGIDIAKNVFHVIGLDANGKQGLKKSYQEEKCSLILRT